jgi:hypothetical protein
VQLFGLSLVIQKYPVIPLMHCQYIVSIYNGLIHNEILTKKQSEFNFFHSLTFNNIDVPHDIRVLQGKTLTNNTDQVLQFESYLKLIMKSNDWLLQVDKGR